MSDGTRRAPTKASLRKLLEQVLHLPEDLDAFCIDHFEDVARQLSGDMSSQRKLNILLKMRGADEIFEVLREGRPADVRKHDALLEWPAAPVPRDTTIPGDLLERIIGIAEQSTWAPRQLARAYAISAPPDLYDESDDDQDGDMVRRMLVKLAYSMGQSDGAHPLLRFVLCLMDIVASAGKPERPGELLSWVHQAAVCLGVSGERVKALQREVRDAARRDDRDVHLVVVMEKHPDPELGYAFHARQVFEPPGKKEWLPGDAREVDDCPDGYCRASQLHDRLMELFTHVECAVNRPDGQLIIELVVPVELLGCDAACRVPDDGVTPPLGADHELVVRSWERAYGPSTDRLQRVRRRWREMWRRLPGPSECAATLCRREDAAEGLGPALHDCPPCVLSFAPDDRALLELVEIGTPIAAWPREPPKDEPRFLQCVAELAERTPPLGWPRAVKRYRSEAYRQRAPAHPGRCFVVLRDDPHKLLPGAHAWTRFGYPAPMR